MEINIISPKQCECGFVPVIPDKNNPAQKIAVRNRWAIIPIPGSVVWLFICPECQKVQPNANFIENIEAVEKDNARRIVAPEKPRFKVLIGKN